MEKKFTVEEAQDKLYTALAEETSFKYLKSQKCLKKYSSNLRMEGVKTWMINRNNWKYIKN